MQGKGKRPRKRTVSQLTFVETIADEPLSEHDADMAARIVAHCVLISACQKLLGESTNAAERAVLQQLLVQLDSE